MSLAFLQSIGLTNTESELYELLLRLGEVPVQEIVTEAKLKRPTVYKALYSLEKKGLVSKKDKNKKIHFRPEPPEKLLSMTESIYTEIERTKDSITSLLPTLTSSYTLSVERPIVRVYEGIDGLQKAHMNEILAEKKEILAYVRINDEIDRRLDSFWKKYYTYRIKNDIHVRSIVPNTKEGIEYKKDDEKQLRITRLVPLEQFPIDIEKNIVGNKVAYFSTQDGKFIITIIENKAIADAERAIFELAWKGSQHYDTLLSEQP